MMLRIFSNIRSLCSFGCVLVAAALLAPGGCYSPTLPLPPPMRDGLTLDAPDADGYVLVRGEPGVIEPGQQVLIINLDTMYGWIVPVDEEGFEVRILAESGDIISVRRKDGDDMSLAIELPVPEPG